jgi:hypothetical protein
MHRHRKKRERERALVAFERKRGLVCGEQTIQPKHWEGGVKSRGRLVNTTGRALVPFQRISLSLLPAARSTVRIGKVVCPTMHED